MSRRVVLGTPGFHPDHRAQPLPLLLVAFQARAKIGGRNDFAPVVAPPVLLLVLVDIGLKIRLTKTGITLLVGLKEFSHIDVQIALVAFERYQIISFLINDLGRDWLLASHRVKRYDASLYIQRSKQLRQHRNLVAFVRGIDAREHHAALAAIRIDYRKHRVPLDRSGPAARLPINRDQPFHVPVQKPHPLGKTIPELPRVQQHQYIPERVLAGDAVLKCKILLQPSALRPAGIDHVGVAAAPAQQADHCYKQNLVERVADVSAGARVFHFREESINGIAHPKLKSDLRVFVQPK